MSRSVICRGDRESMLAPLLSRFVTTKPAFEKPGTARAAQEKARAQPALGRCRSPSPLLLIACARLITFQARTNRPHAILESRERRHRRFHQRPSWQMLDEFLEF